MYKILVKVQTASKNIFRFYQEEGIDYCASSLQDMRPKVLELLRQYGKKNIKIVKQLAGPDSHYDVIDYIVSTEELMRVSDAMMYPTGEIPESNYNIEDIQKVDELINFYLGGE